MQKLHAPRPAHFNYIKKHRQDVTRQIIFPVAFVTVMVLVLAVLIVFGFQSGGDVSKWAAIAIIWMVIPLMAVLLGLLAAAWGLAYLLGRLLEVSPHYTSLAQAYALWFNAQIISWTDKIIEPVLQFKAWSGLLTREEKESEAKIHAQEK